MVETRVPRCARRLFASGFAAAIALVALAAALAAWLVYAPLYAEAKQAQPLLENASRILRLLDESGTLEALAQLANSTDRLVEAVKAYSVLYRELEKHRALILLVYNETHSPGFNDTLAAIEERARLLENEPLIGRPLASTLRSLEKLLIEARSLSALALEALQLANMLPPQEAQKLAEATKMVVEAAGSPHSLVASLRLAEEKTSKALETVEALPPPGTVAAACWAASLASAAAALALARGCLSWGAAGASQAGGPRAP